MRPRVFPAEDAAERPTAELAVAASMRPRVFHAEDWCGAARADPTAGASMRPRVFPAEDAQNVEVDNNELTLQ